jgi:Nif-specific regulatory protein
MIPNDVARSVHRSGLAGEERFPRAMDAETSRVLAELKGQDMVFMLLEIAQLMETHRDPAVIAEGIIAMLSDRIHLLQAHILTASPETGLPEVRFGKGAGQWPVSGPAAGKGSLVGQVIATGKLRLVMDIDKEPSDLGFMPPRSMLPAGKVSFFAVPIFENDTVLGALVAFRQCEEKRSVLHDVDMLRFAAAVIGQSLGVERRVAEETRALREAGKGSAHGILGNSAKLYEALRQTDQVAGSDAPAMLLGESGTGKEKFARMIHQQSRRAEGPFVCINCAAIPPSLLEAELFGYEKGSFTGAAQARKGKIEFADQGTLFLDEIGDLPLELQGKLLRVIQERQIERLGGSDPVKVDFRIITATHVDLRSAVNECRFRLDLFYRLNVFPIYLPPLRERDGDVRIIALHFLNEFNHKYERNVAFDEGVLDRMAAFDWPGNIRQLANVIERAVLTAEARRITRGQFDKILDQESSIVIAKPAPQERLFAPPKEAAGRPEAGDWEGARPYMKVQEGEMEEIARAIRKYGGNKSHAARSLGMTIRQLRYRIERLGITG